MRLFASLLGIGTLLATRGAAAVDADPSTYEAVIPSLVAGDTLDLAPGTYSGNLDIVGLAGTADQPIVIQGPADGSAVFTGNGCCNTVEITDSSYVVVKNLTIDGQGLDGVFGVSTKGNNTTHHITIEGCRFVGHGASQQTVAISTKSPTWGWVIRRNLIDGAGTGLYLGNSDGSQPFVDGVIENNLVMNTIGYNMQIKFQNAWPQGSGLPETPTSTIIRDNVFIKNDAPSPDGDRPNLLVGGFPETGPGSENQYEIYGNLFFHNPREALLQASGRVSIHDNVFVDAVGAAIVVTDHDLPLRRARIYNNTIYGVATGIRFGSSAPEGDFVRANLVFAPELLSGPAVDVADNLSFQLADAPAVVSSPSTMLGSMDFYPLPGQAQGSAVDLAPVAADVHYDVDFNRTPKGMATFRGAYAGEGDNPGWQLDATLKDVGTEPSTTSSSSTGSGAGSGGTTGSGAGSAGAGGGGGASGDSTDGADDGCGCATTRESPRRVGLSTVAILGLVLALRRHGRRS